MSYLESFKHDPLIEGNSNIKVSTDTALEVVNKKLTGNVNVESAAPLTVEQQVLQEILHAINDDSLSKMYIGWMPWL
jgi:phosphatidylinositol kinase/protein kinase (PI-3  family)